MAKNNGFLVNLSQPAAAVYYNSNSLRIPFADAESRLVENKKLILNGLKPSINNHQKC